MKMARRVGYLVVAVISAATVVAAGYTYLKVDDFRDNVTTTPALDEIPNSPPEDDGAEDILLVGSDSRTDAKGKPLSREMLAKLRTTASVGVNTDTLIIVRFPHDGGPPRAVSLPRDSWVRVPTGGKAKINSACPPRRSNGPPTSAAAGRSSRRCRTSPRCTSTTTPR